MTQQHPDDHGPGSLVLRIAVLGFLVLLLAGGLIGLALTWKRQPLAEPPVQLPSPAELTAQGPWLTYTTCLRGNCDLEMIDVSSGEKVRITDTDSCAETWGTWSPDGRYLLLQSKSRHAKAANDLELISLEPLGRRHIIRTRKVSEGWQEWSPDGQRIAFTVTGQNRTGFGVFVCGREGTDCRRVTPDAQLSYARPHWSPEGQRIAYVVSDEWDHRSSDIEVVDLRTNERRLLTEGTPGTNSKHVWLPDGSGLVFTKGSGEGRGRRRGGIYRIDLETGEHSVVIDDPEADEHSPQFSPRGDLMAFISDREGTRDLYVWSVTDRSARLVLRDDALDFLAPRFSADGTLIAVGARPAGTAEEPDTESIGHHLLVVDLDGQVVLRIEDPQWNYFAQDWYPGSVSAATPAPAGGSAAPAESAGE